MVIIGILAYPKTSYKRYDPILSNKLSYKVMVGCTVKKIEVNYNNSKLSQKKFTVSYDHSMYVQFGESRKHQLRSVIHLSV